MSGFVSVYVPGRFNVRFGSYGCARLCVLYFRRIVIRDSCVFAISCHRMLSELRVVVQYSTG